MFHTKVVEKVKTHILCSITFFENRAVYEIMWKYTVERGRPQMTIRKVRSGCWITKAKNTHNQAVKYSLPFHDNNGCTNASRCYVIRTLPVLFSISFMMKVLINIM